MYKEDPSLDTPNNDSEIWRYMDMWKFMDMLKTSTLHFTRIDCLDDPQEGSWDQFGVYTAYQSKGPDYIENLKYWNQVFRTTGAVNCWHVNEYENKQMWDTYVCNRGGVAIMSTFNDLRNVVKKADTSDRVATIGIMKYNEFKQDISCGFGTFIDHFTYKNDSFKHECEIRALIMAMGINGKSGQVIPKEGLKLRVSLDDLIRKIYVNAGNQNWKLDMVVKIISDYDLDIAVEQSQFNPS